MNAAMKVSSGTETLWHALSIAETAKLLDTDPAKGLNPAEAADRLAEYGPNRLPEGKKRGPVPRRASSRSSTTSWCTCCSLPASPS